MKSLPNSNFGLLISNILAHPIGAYLYWNLLDKEVGDGAVEVPVWCL